MKMKIIYNADTALGKEESQNYMVVCDGETGTVYIATDIQLDPAAVPSPARIIVHPEAKVHWQTPSNDNVIGFVDSGKMVFFETKSGPVNDVNRQIQVSTLTSSERIQVLASKAAYYAGKIKPIMTAKRISELRHELH